ncbi:MAG TPA: GNAT family N-acetyltransferase [Gaiellaceae bacterium]|nr:GNAT family N-acetyltransferase [Gaiellaceae bacterium]
MGLAVATIADPEELVGLEDEWDALVLAQPRPSPFLVHCWALTWWRHFGEGARLAVHVARRDGRLVGVLPLFVRRTRGLRVAEFLGGGTSALADVLVAPGEETEVARALVAQAGADEFDYADLFGLPGESRLAAGAGKRLRLVERVEAPVLELHGGWDAVYAAKTSSKKRNLHRRRRRQLAELGHLETTVARSEEELVPALEDAFRLHRLRWEGRPDASDFTTPAGMVFHRAAIRELARRDLARIVSLRLDGRTIAFHYFFVLGGRMVVHHLAFDPSLARFSPGLVNTLDAIAAASAEGLERVEFLGGGERYKLELADSFQPLHQGLGLARTARGNAVAAARVGAVVARRRVKRSERLRRLYYDGLAPLRRRRSSTEA